MSEKLSERRMAENQVVFREHNEKIQKGIDAVNVIAAEEEAKPMHLDRNAPLHFYCECSDDKCRMRIKVTLEEYEKIHAARNRFIIVCGHEVQKIEDVTANESEYCVVTKHEFPPSSADGLNVTNVHNV